MLIQFLKKHSVKKIFILLVEEYVGRLFRFIPSYEGMLLRRFLYRQTCKKMGPKSLIWQQVILTHTYNLSVGSNFCANFGVHIDARGGIDIGDHALIGPNVFIGSSNHAIVGTSVSDPRLAKGHFPKPVKIGGNVWVGANSVVCPGVEIGDNTIIGAGSIVTKSFGSNLIIGGNPAKIIKELNQ